ncbi:class I SAM-dependent methyltransferase [Cytobacillus sp. Hz8]|uniref:class I SAM-dependent methyltransferase n=1 Tax=Cytobacillus sp. Hz8 TaxID=3347168 RepID=UPI0035D5396F
MQNYLKSKILQSPSQQITYADFIHEALYHPMMGYYMRESEKVGRAGDFITTSNISDIYGKVIARWFAKLVEEKGIFPAVLEIGAGNGRFAKSFIEEWKQIEEKPLQYLILEASPDHQKRQQEIIHFDENIKQAASLADFKSFKGMVFSNELFDALPVHVIEKHHNQIMEVMIAVEENELVEKLVPLKNEAILNFIERNALKLQDGQRIEIPLAMLDLVKNIAKTLDQGIIVTVDYGYTNKEWMEPMHKEGSLRGYHKHRQWNDVLKLPGEMDITSHVHFDSLIRAGEEEGLCFYKKMRQDEFFLSIGLLEELQTHADPNPFSEVSRRNRAIRSLIMPDGISSFFHVIIQLKGIDEI